MLKKSVNITDEKGFFTLPLPKPKAIDFAYKWTAYRKLRLWLDQSSHLHRQDKIFFVLGTFTGIVAIVSGLMFFVPRDINLSYGSETCVFNPHILPSTTRHENNDHYQVLSKSSLSVAGFPIFSSSTCVVPISAPKENSISRLALAPGYNPLLKKIVSVKTSKLPSVTTQFDSQSPVGTGSSLAFQLDQPDKTFEYYISVDSKSSKCQTNEQSMVCDLGPLELQPGASYQIVLERRFSGVNQENILDFGLTTLDPVVITNSSIVNGSTVYDSPKQIVLNLNKPVDSVDKLELINMTDSQPLSDTSFELKENVIVVNFQELSRQKVYNLSIGQLNASDGSQLLDTYRLEFTTSGGPKVTSVSIGSYKVSFSSNVALSFDVGLLEKQDFSGKARIEVNDQKVAASYSVLGNRLTINPDQDLPHCTGFTVKLDAGLVNQYGIGNGEAWSYSSRTICQQVFSIGRSVQGRSITAYKFGTGTSVIVFVGGMHGNEKSSVVTLNSWIDYLEAHAHQLPAHRSIVVIPNHNPDAYSSSRRTNANNVDLNRNFPSNDWSTSIQMPGGQNLPNGGGITPLDQPESSSLASYIQSINPRLVLTYHAVARVVISNDVGDSISLGQKYASDSGYDFTSNAGTSNTFEYSTTGEFEDWLADRRGTPALLIELSSMSRDLFSANRSAMWNIASIP